MLSSDAFLVVDAWWRLLSERRDLLDASRDSLRDCRPRAEIVVLSALTNAQICRVRAEICRIRALKNFENVFVKLKPGYSSTGRNLLY